MSVLIKRFSGSPSGDLSFLPSFKMTKLGRRVAIVGQNGAGKSRFLELLANEIWSNRPDTEIVYTNELAQNASVAFIPDDLVLWSEAQNTQDSLFAEHINRILPTVLSVLKETAQQYALSFLPESQASIQAKEAVRARWSSLKENVSDILGRELQISEKGEIQLSGVVISEDSLSKGQSRLLQISVALSAISEDHPIVLIWDEPELHLHPKVVQKVLDVISAKFNCQIWLATHSLTLVSHIGVDSVWYLASDGLHRGIRKKDELLSELFGGDEQVDRLEAFLSPIDELASVNFAKECLGNPEVLGYEEKDPQGKQVFDILKNRVALLDRPVRVLDWGAGKGRLTDAARYEFGSAEKVAEVLDYSAYDISEDNKQECIAAIGKVWTEADVRWTHELTVLKDRYSSDKADFVSLVNVLHEIPPIEWVKVLKDISETLDSQGRLLIVEDLKLPRGEMPHKEGFLLLSEAAMRKLFNDEERLLRFEYKMGKRLMVTSVPGHLVRTNVANLTGCLQECVSRALSEVQDVRRKNVRDFFSGVTHMRAAMQLVNANLSLEKIGT